MEKGFCLFDAKIWVDLTSTCNLRHLFQENQKILVKLLEVEYNKIQSAFC